MICRDGGVDGGVSVRKRIVRCHGCDSHVHNDFFENVCADNEIRACASRIVAVKIEMRVPDPCFVRLLTLSAAHINALSIDCSTYVYSS
jgi:hypothetical protein